MRMAGALHTGAGRPTRGRCPRRRRTAYAPPDGSPRRQAHRVTGVLTDASIAFGVARLAQEQGAEIVLTGAGRGLSLTERTARKLPSPPPVLELDVTVPDHLESRSATTVAERWGRVDGVLHAIGFAPAVCLGGTFMEATWDDVSVALHVSAYSLKALADAFGPLMRPGSALVGLDFDATVAWPAYDWMGVAKAALESTSRYLARELGSRGHPRQPGRRRPDPDDGRQVDPGLLGLRGRLAGHARPSAGTSTTPSPPPGPASPCCPTGSRPRRARWSTSTAATTPSAPDAVGRRREGRSAARAVGSLPPEVRRTTRHRWHVRRRSSRGDIPIGSTRRAAVSPPSTCCRTSTGRGARASGSSRSRSSAARR